MKLGKASDTHIIAKVTAMTETQETTHQDQTVSTEEVERVLAVGRLLLSLLTPDEIETLRETLRVQSQLNNEKGNASVS
jgi:hypothetical protein